MFHILRTHFGAKPNCHTKRYLHEVLHYAQITRNELNRSELAWVFLSQNHSKWKRVLRTRAHFKAWISGNLNCYLFTVKGGLFTIRRFKEKKSVNLIGPQFSDISSYSGKYIAIAIYSNLGLTLLSFEQLGKFLAPRVCTRLCSRDSSFETEILL